MFYIWIYFIVLAVLVHSKAMRYLTASSAALQWSRRRDHRAPGTTTNTHTYTRATIGVALERRRATAAHSASDCLSWTGRQILGCDSHT